MTTPTGGPPVFGEDVTLDVTTITVKAIHRRTHEVAYHEFSVYRDPGPSVVVPLMRAKARGITAEQASEAVGRLIGRALVEDDGLDSDYIPPPPTPDDPDPDVDPRLDDQEQWSSARRFYWILDSGEWQISSTLLEELAQWLIKESHRRAGTPVEGDGPVPTRAPRRSSTGRTTKRPGSTGKRSTRA